MSAQKIVVDSGIIAAHLTAGGSKPTDLRRLMNRFFCYTTVFNAIELFAVCKTDVERSAVEDALHALKILGLNSKNGKNIGRLFENASGSEAMSRLIAGLCIESKLPLVTNRMRAFRRIRGLDVRNVSTLLKSKE